MTIGPTIAGAGLLLAAATAHVPSYWVSVFPSVLIFAVGLALTVAPLTTAVLSALGPNRAGIASGVNTAISRFGGLVAVAILPALSLAGFTHGLEQRLSAATIDPAARAAVLADRQEQGALSPPAALAPGERALIHDAVRASFADGFRWVMSVRRAVVGGSRASRSSSSRRVLEARRLSVVAEHAGERRDDLPLGTEASRAGHQRIDQVLVGPGRSDQRRAPRARQSRPVRRARVSRPRSAVARPRGRSRASRRPRRVRRRTRSRRPSPDRRTRTDVAPRTPTRRSPAGTNPSRSRPARPRASSPPPSRRSRRTSLPRAPPSGPSSTRRSTRRRADRSRRARRSRKR